MKAWRTAFEGLCLRLTPVLRRLEISSYNPSSTKWRRMDMVSMKSQVVYHHRPSLFHLAWWHTRKMKISVASSRIFARITHIGQITDCNHVFGWLNTDINIRHGYWPGLAQRLVTNGNTVDRWGGWLLPGEWLRTASQATLTGRYHQAKAYRRQIKNLGIITRSLSEK